MDVNLINSYKNKNTDILPQLLDFSKSLIKHNVTTQIHKFNRNSIKINTDITQLLNKLCKTNISIICKKIGNPTPEIICEILNYKVNYTFEDKHSFNKAECIAHLLLEFANKYVHSFVLNKLQSEFNDLNSFINNRLIIVREFFVKNILSEVIFNTILQKIIDSQNIAAIILLIQNLRAKKIINNFKPDLLKIIETSNIKLKDKFAILSIIE